MSDLMAVGIDEETTEAVVDSLTERVLREREAVRAEIVARLEVGGGTLTVPQARLQLLLGRIHLDTGEYADGLRLAKETLAWATRAGEKRLSMLAHNQLGLAYWRLGDLVAALESFNRSLEAAVKLGDAAMKLRATGNLGLIHAGQKQWDEAVRLYKETLRMSEEDGDERFAAITAHNLACVLWERDGGTEEALAYNRKAAVLKERLGDAISIATTWNNMVGILRDLGDFAEAHRALDASKRWVEEAGTPFTDFYYALNCGCLLLSLENPQREDEEGFRLLERSRAIAEAGKLLEEEGKACENLARAWAERHEYEKAHGYLFRFKELREQYLALQSTQRIEALRNAFEIQRLEREYREEAARRMEVEALNRRLSALAEDKDGLLKLMGHDLRGHVGAMMGMADLIQRDVPRESLVAEFAGDILSAGQITLNLLEEILRHGKATEGTFASHAPLDLIGAVEEILGQVRGTFRRKEQALTWINPFSEAIVVSERSGIQRVVENLLTNASKFSPRGSAVTVQVELSETRCYRVLVSDEGPGVPPEERAWLFGDEHRLSVRPTEGEATSGMGLVLSREIARKIGGELIYEVAPGGGACFVLSLPRMR